MENLVDLHATEMVQFVPHAGEHLVIPSARLSFPRNPSLVYTTTAAWYSSYVPLKSVILWSLSKCQMRVATSSIKS